MQLLMGDLRYAASYLAISKHSFLENSQIFHVLQTVQLKLLAS